MPKATREQHGTDDAYSHGCGDESHEARTATRREDRDAVRRILLARRRTSGVGVLGNKELSGDGSIPIQRN